MYVVYLEAPKGDRPLEHPFKAFSARPSAITFASEQVEQVSNTAERALIFEVAEADDARKAIAAVQMGEGKFIDGKSRHISEAELDREFKRAMASGPKAFAKYLGLI